MRAKAWGLLVVAMGLAAGPLPSYAQGYDPDYGYDRPPPPRPRAFDPDGYRRPPPPDDGFRRGPPPPYGGYGGPLVCRTEEGSCRARGPQAYRARCLCDFGDGLVRGRMKP